MPLASYVSSLRLTFLTSTAVLRISTAQMAVVEARYGAYSRWHKATHRQCPLMVMFLMAVT